MKAVKVRMILAPPDSQVMAYGYSHSQRRLFVRFRNGGLYCYSKVPADIFIGLSNAASKTIFVNTKVGGKFVVARQTDHPELFAHTEFVEEFNPAPDLKPRRPLCGEADLRWRW